MSEKPLPADIQKFIILCIHSVPHLEALLLLHNDSQQEWDAHEISQRLYTRHDTAGEVLSDLFETGFLAVRKRNVRFYRYSPSSRELGEMVERLEDVYASNLIAVTELIHARGKVKAQQFADAFRLWKD